jgi:hypothetical protein
VCLNETYNKVHIGKHLPDTFPTQYVYNKVDALSSLIFKFILEYAIRMVLENQVGLKLNRTHQMLVYADDINLLGDKINTIKKKTDSLTDATKVVDPEVNTEKIQHILITNHQNAGRNCNIKIANTLSENVAKFKYLGMPVTTENFDS